MRSRSTSAMPGPWSQTETDALWPVLPKISRMMPPSGEWRIALPIRLTRICVTARSSPLAGSASGHGGEHGEQVPGRGSDVAAIARIVAAQWSVRALDDPFGAFNDPVERRTKDL